MNSSTVPPPKVSRRKRKTALDEDENVPNDSGARKISTRSQSKSDTENKDTDDPSTTPNSTSSSIRGRKNKKQQQAPVANEPHLNTGQNAPTSDLQSSIPCRSPIRGRKRNQCTAINDINVSESEHKKPVPGSPCSVTSSKSGRRNQIDSSPSENRRSASESSCSSVSSRRGRRTRKQQEPCTAVSDHDLRALENRNYVSESSCGTKLSKRGIRKKEKPLKTYAVLPENETYASGSCCVEKPRKGRPKRGTYGKPASENKLPYIDTNVVPTVRITPIDILLCSGDSRNDKPKEGSRREQPFGDGGIHKANEVSSTKLAFECDTNRKETGISSIKPCFQVDTNHTEKKVSSTKLSVEDDTIHTANEVTYTQQPCEDTTNLRPNELPCIDDIIPEKLDDTDTNKRPQPSKLVTYQSTVKKRKFRGLLSDTVIQNLKRKKVRSMPGASVIPRNKALNSTKQVEKLPMLSSTHDSFQHSHLDDRSPMYINKGLTTEEHRNVTVKPFNIKINIDNCKQERIVEFAKPIATSPLVENGYAQNATPQYLSDSSSFTNTPMPYADYYCVSNDWFYNVNKEHLSKISSDNVLFDNARLISAADCDSVENSTLNDTMSSRSSVDSSYQKSEFQFLKPCKRPPNRTRTSKSTRSNTPEPSVPSLGGNTPPLPPPPLPPPPLPAPPPAKDDDAISIYSEMSIHSRDFRSNIQPPRKNKEPESISAACSIPKQVINERRIVDLQSDGIVQHTPEATSYKNVAQWVESANMYNNQNKPANYVPPVFRGLCYQSYLRERCARKTCHFIHDFPEINLERLNLSQLCDAFEYAKSRYRLFLAYFHNFVWGFARHNCAMELVTMVGAAVIPQNARQLSSVQEVIHGLQQIGYTFESAINHVLMFYKSTNFDLLNILLIIVFKKENSLCDNWSLVQKLCEYRSYDPIDPELVNRALQFCYQVYSVELSIKIVQDIFKRNLVNPKSIEEHHYGRIISILQRHNAEETNVLIHIAKVNNITIELQNNDECFLPNYNTISPRTVGDLDNSTINFPQPQTVYDTNSNCNNVNFNHTSPTITQVNSNNVSLPPNSFLVQSEHVYQTHSSINGDQNTYSSNSESDLTEVVKERINPQNTRRITPNQDSNMVGTQLHELELNRLNSIISANDHKAFIEMYGRYKDAPNSNAFVLNVIGLFKRTKSILVVFSLMERVLEGLERLNSDFPYLLNAEATLYSLVINTVGALKHLKGFTEAAALLYKFVDCLENLTQVQWFGSVHSPHSYSIIGKYLYFCKIFIRGKFYNPALQMFKCPELKLLQSSSKWDLPYTNNFDEGFRDVILQEFLSATLQNDIDVAKDLILYIMQSGDNIITEIDISKYFDKLILSMLNNQKVSSLIEILPNILQGWYKHLKHSHMRALLIILVEKCIPEKDLLALYKKCCLQGIYPNLKGNETRIILKTDLKTAEIFIIIRYFLYKLQKNNFQTQEVRFTVRMSDQLNKQPNILINSQCGLSETVKRTLIVLSKCFPSVLIAQCCGNDITVEADNVKLCVESFRKFSSRSFWTRQSSVDRLCK
ncbi:hypothetical protein PPYR_15231 [Photinus pyralis]|uniref:Protein TOPAZ1 n=1 Tax=Photinus pyralis TaxID=7054 RepID=A0A5N3ZZC7_PHOPY|nr:uncharacterized protein LOC116182174 isoform X2 [Photinus pyralis]KAB0790399.1 hypothetical protein PPYR_15231 [Photinus pyralis]